VVYIVIIYSLAPQGSQIVSVILSLVEMETSVHLLLFIQVNLV